ncbi:MAG: hypothetical protein ACTH69_16250 [Halomonas sp.]|uniref:hypothetical protein n=1 Tax=Gammaproteobacteria TaxID=1236 RepID=UPI00192338B2|nr:hypothetical protein [Pseudomonas paraversuta]
MKHTKKVDVAASAIRKLWENHGIKEPMRFLGFCLSLLPIPGISQAGLVLDRHLSDKGFEKEVENIWNAIKRTNENIATISPLEDAIAEVARTVNTDDELIQKTSDFLSRLANNQSEFRIITDENSLNEIINTLIEAENTLITTSNNSNTLLENVRVNSNKTSITTTNNSSTRIDKSIFSAPAGAVKVAKTSTKGHVEFLGNEVRLHGNSELNIFESGNISVYARNKPLPEDTIDFICPRCQHSHKLKLKEIITGQLLVCVNCRACTQTI